MAFLQDNLTTGCDTVHHTVCWYQPRLVEIQSGEFTFVVLAYPSYPGKEASKWVICFIVDIQEHKV